MYLDLFPLIDELRQIFHVHFSVDKPGSHRGRHAERFVFPDPIVPAEIERQRVAMILEFF
jgi:hypothetical protein